MTTENNKHRWNSVPSGLLGSHPGGQYLRMQGRPKDKPAISVRDYLSMFFKQKRTILVSFIAIICLALIYPLFIYTAKFQAKSLLLVKFGWENFSPDLLPDNRRLPSVNQTEIVQSEVSILKSRELRERVVESLKPERIFSNLSTVAFSGMNITEAALYRFEQNLTVTPDKGNTITVAFAGSNPEVSSTVVNQLVDAYLERRNEIYKDPRSVLFLERKADEYAQKLGDAENRLKSFQNESNIVSFDEQRALLLTQQYDLRSARAHAQSDKKGYGEKVSELEREMESIPRYSQRSEEALSYRIKPTEQKILELQLLERDLASKYKDDNKLLIGARDRLKIAVRYMENQRRIKPAEVVDPAWQELQKQALAAKSEVAALDAQIKAIDARMTQLDSTLQNFDSLEQKNKALVREVADFTEKYNNYRQRVEEARIFDELNRQKMTSVSVVERASPTNVPTNPFKPLFIYIPIVLAVAVFGSLAIAYFVETLGQGLSTPGEAEKRLGLPVLTSISAK